MRLIVLLMLAACWRNSPPPEPPQLSFVARVNALAELRRDVRGLASKLELAMHRIVGLTSEAERGAIRKDLAAIDAEVSHLIEAAAAARARGEDRTLLADVEGTLAAATVDLANLRVDLVHAKTLAEQRALEEQRKLQDASDSDGRLRSVRRRNVIVLPAEQKPELPAPRTPGDQLLP